MTAAHDLLAALGTAAPLTRPARDAPVRGRRCMPPPTPCTAPHCPHLTRAARCPAHEPPAPDRSR